MRGTRGALPIVCALVWAACNERPATPTAPTHDSVAAVLAISSSAIVSEPQTTAAGATVSAASRVAYVSLPPGTLSRATLTAQIRNLTAAGPWTPPIPVVDGGMDPVAIAASAGDTLELTATDAAGDHVRFVMAVPAHRPPTIVRTSPPQGKTDVPLNSRLIVVFSEPVDSATVGPHSLLLLRAGAPVSGKVRLTGGSALQAELTPDAPLEPATTYELAVTQGVRALDGEALEPAVQVSFQTAAAATPPQVLGLWISPWDTSIVWLGSTRALAAIISGDSVRPAKDPRWTSLNEAVLRVDSITGIATGVAMGSAVVLARAEGLQRTRVISVFPPPTTTGSTALTVDSFSVASFGSTGQDYAPLVHVTAAPGRSVAVLTVQFMVPGIGDMPLGCYGVIPGGASRHLTGEDWLFVMSSSGNRATGEDATAVVTFTDDTGAAGSITVRGHVVSGTDPWRYAAGGACSN